MIVSAGGFFGSALGLVGVGLCCWAVAYVVWTKKALCFKEKAVEDVPEAPIRPFESVTTVNTIV